MRIPEVINRLTEFIRTYDNTVGALLGAITSFVLLLIYDRRRFRGVPVIRVVRSQKKRIQVGPNEAQLKFEAQIDVMNIGGSDISLLRPTAWLRQVGTPFHPVRDFQREDGTSFYGMLLRPHQANTFTLTWILLQNRVNPNVWGWAEGEGRHWELSFEFSNGTRRRLPVWF